MDFLLVSETKLKIMLNSEEMRKYKLDSSELDYADPEIRGSFWRILDIANEKCGFNAKGEKLLIQFYPSKTGGEIFITKLGALSKSAERSISGSGRVAMLTSETKIYKFDSLTSLVAAVHTSIELLPENTKAYVSESGEYYLIFEERNTKGIGILSEYAREVPKNLEFYIEEHSELIENSVSTLNKLYYAGES